MHGFSKPAFIVFALAWLGGCAAMGPQEYISFSGGAFVDLSQWKIGHESPGSSQVQITEYIHRDDDINNWREMITSEAYAPLFATDAEDMFERFKAIRDRDCPGLIQWTVIARAADSVVYETVSAPCRGFGASRELTKVMSSKDNRWRLRYDAKGAEWEPGQREQWLKVISDAKVLIMQ